MARYGSRSGGDGGGGTLRAATVIAAATAVGSLRHPSVSNH